MEVGENISVKRENKHNFSFSFLGMVILTTVRSLSFLVSLVMGHKNMQILLFVKLWKYSFKKQYPQELGVKCQELWLTLEMWLDCPCQVGSEIDVGEENIVSPPSCILSFLVISGLITEFVMSCILVVYYGELQRNSNSMKLITNSNHLLNNYSVPGFYFL